MRIKALTAVAASLFLGWSASSLAQKEESRTCDALIGQEREHCLNEGGTIKAGTGSRGNEAEVVRKVEEALVAQGYDPGPVDGKWTQKTEEAVKQAQKDREFEPSGRLDQRTLASIGIRDADNPFMSESSASAGGTRPESAVRALPAPSQEESSSR